MSTTTETRLTGQDLAEAREVVELATIITAAELDSAIQAGQLSLVAEVGDRLAGLFILAGAVGPRGAPVEEFTGALRPGDPLALRQAVQVVIRDAREKVESEEWLDAPAAAAWCTFYVERVQLATRVMGSLGIAGIES